MSQAEFRGVRAGVQIWEIKRSEIAFVNRREGAKMGDNFGVPRWEKPLYLSLI
jgi:hypothetical protein